MEINNFNNNISIITRDDYADLDKRKILEDFMSYMKDSEKEIFMKKIKNKTLIWALSDDISNLDFEDGDYIKILLFIYKGQVERWSCELYDEDCFGYSKHRFYVIKNSIIDYLDFALPHFLEGADKEVITNKISSFLK